MMNLYMNANGVVTDSKGNALAITDSQSGETYYLRAELDGEGNVITEPDGSVKYYKAEMMNDGSFGFIQEDQFDAETGDFVTKYFEVSMDDEDVRNAIKPAIKDNTKYILEQIRIEGEIKDLIAKTDGENVSVTWKDGTSTLAAALADILTSLTNLPTAENVDGKISAAIDSLISDAPETYDTLKEIADYIESHQSVSDALNAAIGDKVDKEEGKGLSAEDFTTALKTKLENLTESIATHETDGLMSKEDKSRLDGLRGVRYGTELPDDMKDGELFIRVVNTSV